LRRHLDSSPLFLFSMDSNVGRRRWLKTVKRRVSAVPGAIIAVPALP
jgi:hypothetical protein